MTGREATLRHPGVEGNGHRGLQGDAGRESEEDEDAAAGDEGIEGDEGSQHEADRDADGDEGIEGDEDTESARGTVRRSDGVTLEEALGDSSSGVRRQSQPIAVCRLCKKTS